MAAGMLTRTLSVVTAKPVTAPNVASVEVALFKEVVAFIRRAKMTVIVVGIRTNVKWRRIISARSLIGVRVFAIHAIRPP